jgi:hypothetical protein
MHQFWVWFWKAFLGCIEEGYKLWQCCYMISVHMCNIDSKKISTVLEYFLCLIGNIAETWSNCSLRSDGGKLRLWFRACNGYVQAHTAPKKCGCQTRKARQCWFILLQKDKPNQSLRTDSFSHLVTLPSRNFVSKFRNVWDSVFVMWGQIYSPTTGSCNMTMHPLTHSAFRLVVFGEEIYRDPGTLLLLTRSRSTWLFRPPTMKYHFEGSHFETWKGFRKLWHQSKQLVRETYGSASTVENNAEIYV